jgi:Amt family ammonium transporter
LGTILLWFGWFGFNGGSALGANPRAIMAMIVTNLAASVGGLTWMLLDYRLEKKFSALGFCSGAIAGLVCITPGSGYVAPASSVAFGLLGGLACNMAVKLKHIFDFDDALDVFAVHGVGGIVGNLLTGVFAQRSISLLGGTPIKDGGMLDGHHVQLAYQLASSVAGLGYSFVMTYILLFLIDKIPGLSLRLHPEKEELGVDESELGEVAYYFVDKVRSSCQQKHPENSTKVMMINSGQNPNMLTQRSLNY